MVWVALWNPAKVTFWGTELSSHFHSTVWPTWIVTEVGTIPSLALAPMAVLPEFQNQGIGSALVRRGLEMCREKGHKIVVVVGHPQYYPRFGFSPQLAADLASPFSGKDFFMALELVSGALDGVKGRVQYPPPFGV